MNDCEIKKKMNCIKHGALSGIIFSIHKHKKFLLTVLGLAVVFFFFLNEQRK